jgi:transposase-like protein
MNRRGQDIFIACVDGLKGLPQAIEAVFPKAQVQPCIVHLVWNCLNYVSWKERKTVAADLKPIYRSTTSDDAWQQLARSPKSGTAGVRASARSGGGTGIRSARFSHTRRKSARSFTRPTPWSR